MKTPPSYDEISRRAYFLWEERGRPEDQQSSIDCWLQAEDELWKNTRRDDDASEADASREDDDEEVLGGPDDGLRRGVDISNLDRGLPADERRRARDQRNAPADAAGKFNTTAPESFFVIASRGALRIYDAANKTPQLVHGADIPGGQQDYTDNDTDQAGRFPGSVGRGRGIGGSIDERLPMQEEQQRRIVRACARQIEEFLGSYPTARWHFAAGPALHQPLLKELDPEVRARIERTVTKDLVNIPLAELARHFDRK